MYGSSSSLSAHRRFDLNLQKLQSHRIASHFVAFALRLPPPPARGDEGKKKESSIPWKYIWLISSSMTKMQLHWQRNWHVPAMEGWRKETVSPPWSLKETASFPWLKKERTYGFSLWSLKKRMWFFIWSRSKKQLYRFSRGSRAQGSRFLLFRNFLFVKSRVWGSCRGVCGSFCICCPSLRSRSRQPVKRYKKLVADVFQVRLPRFSVLVTSVKNW